MIKIKIMAAMVTMMMMSSQAMVVESVGVSIRHALSRARDMALACCLLALTNHSLVLVVSRFKWKPLCVNYRLTVSWEGTIIVCLLEKWWKTATWQRVRVANPWEWLTIEWHSLNLRRPLREKPTLVEKGRRCRHMVCRSTTVGRVCTLHILHILHQLSCTHVYLCARADVSPSCHRTPNPFYWFPHDALLLQFGSF